MNKMQSFFGVWTVIFILQKHRLPNFNPGEANNYNIYQSSQSTYHTKLHLHSVASRYILLDKARIFFFFFFIQLKLGFGSRHSPVTFFCSFSTIVLLGRTGGNNATEHPKAFEFTCCSIINNICICST